MQKSTVNSNPEWGRCYSVRELGDAPRFPKVAVSSSVSTVNATAVLKVKSDASFYRDGHVLWKVGTVPTCLLVMRYLGTVP